MTEIAKLIPGEKAIERMVKLSICGNCKGWVRACDWDRMDLKAKKVFSKEVVQYNLAVKHIPLSEFNKLEMCKC